jgi:hypothetical protein
VYRKKKDDGTYDSSRQRLQRKGEKRMNTMKEGKQGWKEWFQDKKISGMS